MDRHEITKMIGERIRQFRETRGLSQEELGFESDINPSYIGRLERGEKCPTIESLYKISIGLKVPLTKLVDISATIEPTNDEAIERIKEAISSLSGEEAVEVAEIVEKVVKMLLK